jgi:hypothetical protein
MCGFDANIVPNGVSQADIADFFDPGHSDPDGNIGDIRGILSSTDVDGVRKALSKLRCLGGDSEKGLVTDAWAARNSGASNLATCNFSVRVLMARCYVDITSRASQDKIPVAVKEQLREAVKGTDPIDFIVGVEGLARIASAADIRLIENATKGRSSVLADVVVQNLTRTCAPGAQEAVAEIRKNTTKPKAARDMDYQIGVAKRVREYICSRKVSLSQ